MGTNCFKGIHFQISVPRMDWPKNAPVVQTSGCFSFPISSAQFLLSIDHSKTYLTLTPNLLRHCYCCLVTKSCFFATPGTAAHQASLSFTSFQSLLKLMSIESVMPSNHLILCHPLLLLPSVFPRVRWPKYWSFSFSTSPSNEYSGLISFRIDYCDLLAVQGTV